MNDAARERYCGDCHHYWSLKDNCILPYWAEVDRAGECLYPGMGQPFVLREDKPIFGDCWKDGSI